MIRTTLLIFFLIKTTAGQLDSVISLPVAKGLVELTPGPSVSCQQNYS